MSVSSKLIVIDKMGCYWEVQRISVKTTEICQIAIGNNPKALKYVNNQTPELCKLAIQLNPIISGNEFWEAQWNGLRP